MDTCTDDFPVERESGAVSLGDTNETAVVSEVGSFSCCDVWLRVPGDWIPRVTLRVYGRVGKARVRLHSVALAALATTVVGGLSSAIAASLRGRPVRSFEVTCQASAGAPLSDGHFYLQAWHGKSTLGASVGDSAASTSITARLVGRDATTGAATEVATDGDGRLRVTGGGA